LPCSTAWIRPCGTNVVDERGLGGILVHHLGASQRWRHAFQDTGESPSPELEPLPTIDELRERWDVEWAAVDAWLPTVTDGFVGYVHDGVPVWQMLVHVVNHGTQHRAEAAALLTAEGRSPGEIDLIEVIQTYASGDLAVLVAVERQSGVVGDYPAQDWSLRVTLVFRREGSTWQLAHRHADALVHPITFDRLAELARGRGASRGGAEPTGPRGARGGRLA
jgi:ketosteroid isomerase-like protein